MESFDQTMLQPPVPQTVPAGADAIPTNPSSLMLANRCRHLGLVWNRSPHVVTQNCLTCADTIDWAASHRTPRCL